MAQAARLSMRMQKELKLLLSDPPHGASFPHLSSAASGSGDFSSFSTIDAQIEGPEDTVYANGVFNVKIQIPERYPFQPPIVAFATPIYHPNIDNSGRICLDILNLPPKFLDLNWTMVRFVILSTGCLATIIEHLYSFDLLLSEPNPDDGLMCEVSKEYKYNRQTFDYKAREMTEKCAKVKACDGSSTSLRIERSPNAGDVKVSENGNSVLAGNHEKHDGVKLKLTVESDTLNSQLLLSSSGDQQQKDGNGKRKAVIGFPETSTSDNDGIITSRKKLSLALPPQSQKKDSCGAEELTNGVSPACKENKKPNSYGKKLSLGVNHSLASSSFRTSSAKSDYSRLNQKLSLRGESQLNEVSKDEVLAEACTKPEMNQNEDDNEREASLPESIVVLESDESGGEEEATVSSRSRLSLARRPLKCRP